MGDLAGTAGKVWTAEEFLRTDQREFGDAWRYELVDGRIVAHTAPTPAHAKIVAALTGALTARMSGDDGCFPESGSGAAPENQQHANARIPDVMIRCRGLPRVLFEVLSPSELKRWRERDRKRLDEQDITGVEEKSTSPNQPCTSIAAGADTGCSSLSEAWKQCSNFGASR